MSIALHEAVWPYHDQATLPEAVRDAFGIADDALRGYPGERVEMNVRFRPDKEIQRMAIACTGYHAYETMSYHIRVALKDEVTVDIQMGEPNQTSPREEVVTATAGPGVQMSEEQKYLWQDRATSLLSTLFAQYEQITDGELQIACGRGRVIFSSPFDY